MLTRSTELGIELKHRLKNTRVDAAAFLRKYRRCETGECESPCCYYGGQLLESEVPEFLKTVQDKSARFRELGVSVPELPIYYERIFSRKDFHGWNTRIRPYQFTKFKKPEHFTSTMCVFFDGRGCSLQKIGTEEGVHPWSYKPLSCWLYPISIGTAEKPEITIYSAETDPFQGKKFKGFNAFTPCASGCAEGDFGYKVFEPELAKLGELIERDLIQEILALGKGGNITCMFIGDGP